MSEIDLQRQIEELRQSYQSLEDSFRNHKHAGYDLTQKIPATFLRYGVRLYSSNFTSVSSSGTDLQTLRTFNLIGGELGRNGILEIIAYFTSTNTDANRPQLRIKTTAVGVLGKIVTDGICVWKIVSRNSQSSQMTFGFERVISSEVAPVMAATASLVDLSATVNIDIRCQPDTTEVLTLQSYFSILYPSVT